MHIIIPITSCKDETQSSSIPHVLIEVNHHIALEYILSCFADLSEIQYTYVFDKSMNQRFHLDHLTSTLTPNRNIVISDIHAQGPLCASLLAIDYLKDEEPIMIVNDRLFLTTRCSQILDWFTNNNCDAGFVCVNSIQPKLFHAKVSDNNSVIEVSNEPISYQAIIGPYYFKHSCDFIQAAFKTVSTTSPMNNEYAIEPVFNTLILSQKKVNSYTIETDKYVFIDDQSKQIDFPTAPFLSV